MAGLFGRKRQDSDVAAEFESHIAMQAEENQRRGMNGEEARRQAIIKLGGIEQAKESYRDQQSVPVVENLLQDVRYGVRMLRANPGFTLVAVLTLALGIGANTAIFSIVNGVLLRPLPYEDPVRLVEVFNTSSKYPRFTASPPDFRTLREQNRTLAGLSASYGAHFTLTGAGHPERLDAAIVSADYFSTLGVKPMLGRAFLPDEEKWGAHRVIVVSEGFWRNHLNADPDISGKLLNLDGELYQVVGVMPASFYTTRRSLDLWAPMAWKPNDNANSHNNYFVYMIGRLNPGVSQAQASSDLNAIMLAIGEKFPENKGIGVGLEPLHETWVSEARPALLVLLGAVGLVLLVACVNLANLLFARVSGRQKEIGIRSALGASRRRLLQQFMTESLLLAGLGGSIGLALAYFSLKLLPLTGDVLPRIQLVRVDGWVLFFTSVVSVATALLFGLLPALESSRNNKLNYSLKEGGRTSHAGSGSRRIRGVLVISEVALALVLLIASGLALRSLQRLLKVDPGFSPERVLTFDISFPQSYDPEPNPARIGAPPRLAAFYREAQARLEQLPGVKAAGAASGLPLEGENWGKFVTVLDRPLPTSLDKVDHVNYRVVSGRYFNALNIRLIKGRFLDDHDQATSPYVVVVNEAFAHKYWPGQDPIGKMLQMNPPESLIPKELIPPGAQIQTFTVVGVVGNAHYEGLDQAPEPLVYGSVFQHDFLMHSSFVVRSELGSTTLVPSIRSVISQLDKDLPVNDIITMDEIMSTSVAQPRLETILLGIFGGLAMLLAAVGIYGVMSYSVSERTGEIGVRMALGADRGDVLALVCKQGLRLAAIGLAAGLVLALLATRLMSKILFGVSPTDPVTFAAIIVLLALVALLACYVPARRATKVDPMVALRYE
jgi:putative ABC transport system permease protein